VGNEVESLPRRTIAQRSAHFVPWLALVTASGSAIFAFDGTERALAVGFFITASFGALVGITQVRGAVSSMRAWMGTRESDLSTFADDRAAAVARQFAWAVEELVNVRAELRRVETLRVQAEELAADAGERARHGAEELDAAKQKMEALDESRLDELREKLDQAEQLLGEEERDRQKAERRARVAEERVAELSRTLRVVANTVSSGAADVANAPLVVEWTLEYDGTSHTLRLHSSSPDVRPNRARVVDMSGRVIAESVGTLRRSPQLMLAIPPSVAAAVESADWSAFRLEVEIDEAWEDAALVSRVEPVVDTEVMRPRALRIVS
jgi:hypothetical protein